MTSPGPAFLPAPPSTEDIETVLDVLDRLASHLGHSVRVEDTQPLLAAVLHEEFGLPRLLGSILLNAASRIEDQALLPWPVEIREIIDRLRAHAPGLTACHALHQDAQLLRALPFYPMPDAPAPGPRP
ncbi:MULTISPECIES: hypothetical protein [unclassified Streptomyces]|uniref:hypothetical protein n=1 Tax=unclassified Streptomyces TaxID=2593676 RepID=UPI00363C0945